MFMSLLCSIAGDFSVQQLFSLYLLYEEKFSCADLYFHNGIFSKVILHSAFAGLSLAIWSTGVMYAAEISSPFNAYLLGYAFPPLISALILILGCTFFRKSNKNNSHLNQVSNIESSRNSHDGNPKAEDVFHLGEHIRQHHVSINEKAGTAIFYFGVLVLLLSRIFYFSKSESHKAFLTGDGIAFLSAISGIVFQWIFIYYSMKHIYRVIEFLLLVYIFAAVFLTVTTMIFFDDSSYKTKSLYGWISYSTNSS